ncbi:MAG: MFS transporter [Deltaproteobacteria bacterium]|jgi:MFS family permease|nr:MFS transporter [Deltaproteobacteria bacterium]
MAGFELASPEDIRHRRLVIATAVSANLLGNIGLIGVNVAAPAISRQMGMSAAEVGWLSLATLLTMAMFSAPVARLSDLVGRRRVTIYGLWVAIIGSALGALANSPLTLLISRGLTGLGLVAFFTTVTTMAAAAYPPQMRGRALGLTISSVYIGLSVAPLLAGLLVESLGWPALFWFTVIGLTPPAILVLFIRQDPPPDPGQKLDYPGAGLWTLAIALLFSGLASLGFNASLGAIGAGAILMVWFVRRSLASPSPILDITLFRDSRRFSFSSLAAFISYISSFSVSFLLSLYLQYPRGLSPSEAGWLLICQPVVQAILTPFAGRLSDRIDAGVMASLGLGLILAALLVFANNLTLETSRLALVLNMGLFGAGFALFSAPNSNAIMGAVPPQRLGQASGVITVTRLSGQITSIAVTTMVFSLVIGPGELQPELFPRLIQATQVCFWAFTPLALLGMVASLARGAKNPVSLMTK